MLFLSILLLLATPANGSDLQQEQAKQFGTDALEDALPNQAEALLGDVKPTEQTDLLQGITSIFQKGLKQSGSYLKRTTAVMLRILMVVVLCQLADSIGEEREKTVSAMTGALAVTACCITDLQSMIGLGRNTMDELANFSNLLLPVMTAAATASGSATAAGGVYTVTVFFSNLLVQISNGLIIPAIYAYVGLATADAVLQQERLKRFRELLGWLIEKGLRAIVYLFTGLLTMTGVLSGSTDAAVLKATKTAISTMVPVVGSIISGAAEMVLNSASLLKTAIGTFGMLAILAMFLLPFLQLGFYYLMFKLTSALSGILGSRMTSLLDSVSSAMGFLLGMTGSCALISLLSCCCFLKVVQI